MLKESFLQTSIDAGALTTDSAHFWANAPSSGESARLFGYLVLCCAGAGAGAGSGASKGKASASAEEKDDDEDEEMVCSNTDTLSVCLTSCVRKLRPRRSLLPKAKLLRAKLPRRLVLAPALVRAAKSSRVWTSAVNSAP